MQKPTPSGRRNLPAQQLLLLVAILSCTTALAAAAVRDTDGRHLHALSRRLPSTHDLARSRIAVSVAVNSGSWRAAQRRCVKRGGELPRLMTSSSASASLEALTQQVARWPAGRCYWLGDRYSRSLRPLVENPHSHWRRSGGCLCARVVEGGDRRRRRRVLDDGGEFGGYYGSGGRRDDDAEARTRGGELRLRLHLDSCRRALPFRCHSGTKTTTTTRTIGAKSSTTTPAAAAAATTRPPVLADEFVPADEADPDEALDHDKFPEIEVGPDGHPKGWLPPWHALTSPTPSPSASSGLAVSTSMSIDFDNKNSNRTGQLLGSGTLAHMWQEQRSEFITLVVLYTIVGVICTVLLALCLVRCCRGYCGKAKVRYVRQVDADDIPRFMPSSWA